MQIITYFSWHLAIFKQYLCPFFKYSYFFERKGKTRNISSTIT